MNMLSHELRTPLAIIAGYADLLQDEAGEDLGHLTEPIRTAVERMQHVVDSLLAYEASRTEATITPLAPRVEGSRIPLDHLVGRTMQKVQRRHPDAHAHIAMQLEHSVSLPTDVADALSTALEHVLDNAVKFSHQHIHVSSSSDEHDITLTVRDDGPGLPEKSIAIFSPFQQGTSGLDREQGGLGMGLFLAKRSLKQVAGSIQLSGNEGGTGATATIRIPVPVQPALRRVA